MQRRTLLRWILSGAAAWPLRGVHLHAQAADVPAATVAQLRALAPALLPSELGAAGHDKVVNDFVQWLASYRGGAERSWGYGHPEASATPHIDVNRYRAQLDDLDRAARTRSAVGGTLATDAGRALVVETLESIGARTLPGAPDGRHVLTDLMAFYYRSGPAADLCYRARIARVTCRGLAGAGTRPAPLTQG